MIRQRSRSHTSLRNRIVRSATTVGEGGKVISTRSWVYNPGYQSIDTVKNETIIWEGNGRAYWHECSHEVNSEIAIQPSWTTNFTEEYYRRRWPLPPGYTRVISPSGAVCVQVAPNFTSDVGFYVPDDGVYKPTDPTKDPSLVSQIDWGTAWEAVMDDAAGLMPSDISVGVNIAEFASLKRMVPSLAASVTRILKWAKGQPNKTVRRYRYLFDKKTGKRIPWTAEIETVKLRSLSWSLRDLASLNLGFSFGVLPLADDLGNWAGKLYQVQQHLNWLTARNKTFWARARTNTVEQEDDRGDKSTRGTDGIWTVNCSTHTTLVGNLHVQCRADLKTGSAKYNALLSQVLGVNVPLQLAWDLVPFSFVVDWFLPVGKMISRIEPRRALGSLTRRLSVLQTWYSLQGEDRYLAKCVSLEPYSSDKEVHLDDPGRMEKSKTTYVRLRGTPVYNLIPTGKVRFGSKQFELSLSLLVQRFTSRR